MNTPTKPRSYEILRAIVCAVTFGVGFWALGQVTWLAIVAALFAGAGWLLADSVHRGRS